MATPRLHYDDPLRLEGEATVLAHCEDDGRNCLILDQTIFYPESGGQMADRGSIDGRAVSDVQLAEDGTVHHFVTTDSLPAVGSVVSCIVDAARRRQHMALHTAQHCLSRALVDRHEAITLSSRLGASGCTIDVDRSGLSLSDLEGAQDLVNAIIDEDRTVRQYFPDAAELDALPLRKPAAMAGPVRVVDVGGFDVTPCGGTHVTHTAQIELVYVRGVERYKGGTRLTFDAGPRARAQLLTNRRDILAVATILKCAPHEVVQTTETQRDRLEDARRGAKSLREALAEQWAEQLGEENPIVRSLPGADAALLKAVAARLTTGARVVALAAPASDGIAVLIARGPESALHAGDLLRELATRFGGRGGGRPNHAQGRLPTGADFENAVRDAVSRPSGDG